MSNCEGNCTDCKLFHFGQERVPIKIFGHTIAYRLELTEQGKKIRLLAGLHTVSTEHGLSTHVTKSLLDEARKLGDISGVRDCPAGDFTINFNNLKKRDWTCKHPEFFIPRDLKRKSS